MGWGGGMRYWTGGDGGGGVWEYGLGLWMGGFLVGRWGCASE